VFNEVEGGGGEEMLFSRFQTSLNEKAFCPHLLMIEDNISVSGCPILKKQREDRKLCLM
jgi:hypothetical protein